MSYTTYLAHHGIKGQKWGVRRFQNYDGTRIKDPLANAKKNYKTVKKTFVSSDDFGQEPEYMHMSFKDRLLNPKEARQVNYHNSRIVDFRRNQKKIEKLVDDAIGKDPETTSKLKKLALKVKETASVCVEDYTKNADFYRTVAGLSAANTDRSRRAKSKGWSTEDIVDAYRQGPKNLADESSFNSYDFCLVANGKNPNEVRKAYFKAGNELDSFSWKTGWDTLGDYAKKYIPKKHNGGYAGSVLGEYIRDAAIMKVGGIKHNPIEDTSWGHAYTDDELKKMKSDLEKYRDQANSIINSRNEVSHSVIVNDDIYSYRSYLAHHGIKGQKWGVRRFQKADGSLTAAGAKRYGIKSAMSAGRKVGSGLVKAARGGIQKAKEAKARKAAEKLERQKKVWAKTRLGLTMNADKFTIEELREANNRLDERDRAARGLAEQVKRGVGYFQAIRDITGAIKDTKDYIEDISGEKERKQKAADELKYQRQLEKEERDHQRALEKDKLSAERDIDYKREKDQLDRESRERISKYTVDAKNKKDDSDKPSASAKPNDPDGPNNGGGSDKISYKGYEFDREFLKKINPEVYKAAIDAEASRERQKAAQKRALDRVVKETESSTVNRESKSDESPKPTKSDKAESTNNVDQHRVEKYREFAKNIDASDLSADDKVKYKKSFYSKVKAFKGDTEEFNLETERTLDIAKGLKKSADNRKAAEARQKAEAEANREETTEERQKRKIAEGKAYGAEAQYQANMSQLNLMSDSQLAKMAVRRKTSEVVDTVKSFNPKSMAEKYLASGERKRQEQEARRIAEMSVENLERNYKAMGNKFGQDVADRSLTEYTEKARNSVAGMENKYGFVGKTYKPDEKRMAKDRQELKNYKTQEQIDANAKDIKKYRKDVEKYANETSGIGKDLYEYAVSKINKLEEENQKLRKNIKHSDISAYGAYLAHHGIKGQKWGIRRFQNEDGTLTKAGLRRQAKAEKFRSKELDRYNKNIDRAIERGQKNTKQMYEKLADHLIKMTVDDIYKEHRAVRTKAVGKAVLAGVATTLASSVAGLPNIASIPIGVAMGKAASAGTRDKYRLEQIAHAVIFADDNALEHHGIKGQKWGVRRFQDEAGRLTSAGKKRAAELRDKVTSKLKINAKSIDFEAQGGGGGGTIDGWEDVSKAEEGELEDTKDQLLLALSQNQLSKEEIDELATAFGYKFDDSLPMDANLQRLHKAITKMKGSDLKTAMFDFQQTQRKKVSYRDGIMMGVSSVVNALFSSNLLAVADPAIFVKDVISAEKAKSEAEKRKEGEPIDKKTGLHIKQNTDASREEDLKDVNPGWKNLATNTKHNCMCCTATYDMRRRGYDVTANEVQFGYDYGDVTRWYPDAKVKHLDTEKLERKYVHEYSEDSQAKYKQEVNKQLQKELVAQGDGARGNLMVKWNGGGGHSMAYEVIDGVAYVYDGQANVKKSTMEVVLDSYDVQYARLDNVDFDPEKIKEVVH